MKIVQGFGGALLAAVLVGSSQFATAAATETLGAICEKQAKEAGVQGEEATAMFVSECVEEINTARAADPAAANAEGDKAKQGE